MHHSPIISVLTTTGAVRCSVLLNDNATTAHLVARVVPSAAAALHVRPYVGALMAGQLPVTTHGLMWVVAPLTTALGSITYLGGHYLITAHLRAGIVAVSSTALPDRVLGSYHSLATQEDGGVVADGAAAWPGLTQVASPDKFICNEDWHEVGHLKYVAFIICGTATRITM